VYEKEGDNYALIIKGVELKEAGKYSVKATNEVGNISAKAKLKVKGNYYPWVTTSNICDNPLDRFNQYKLALLTTYKQFHVYQNIYTCLNYLISAGTYVNLNIISRRNNFLLLGYRSNCCDIR